MREETRANSQQPFAAISATRDLNPSPGLANFSVVYW